MTTTMPRTSGKRGPQPYLPSRWVALALLASAQLMLVLDVTVVNVALPDIGVALHLQRGELPWVMTIYTVFFGGLMLLGGRLADLFGARRMTLGGLALFTAASLLCGLSGNAATLLAGRSMQGLGAALMSPAALAAVMTLFTGASRGKALGVWSALAGVGSALGVVLGGVLTSEAGWRWVFTINVPIGVALLIAIPLVVPARPPSEAAERSLDVPGAALVTAGTAAAIYGLINVGSHGWAAASTLVPILLAVAIWTVFARPGRRVRRPLLAVGLLRRRAVLAGSFLMLAATGLLVGGLFLGSFALQQAHGYSALHMGLVFLPAAVAIIAGAQAGTRVLTRVNARIVAVTGLALAAAGYAVAAGWTQPALIVTGLGVAALGIGATFVTAFTDQGAGIIAALGRALTSQPVVLAVHAVLGLLMLVAGVSVLVRAIVARHRLAIASSAAGLAAIAAAAFSGAAFVSNGQDGASMAMAILTGVALLCYLANLLAVSPPRPTRE
jgi:Major Facilitator Superfamily